MSCDYATLKIHKHNFKDYFQTSLSFENISSMYLQGKPAPHSCTKKQLGISDSFIQVNYFFVAELLLIANLKIRNYEATNPLAGKSIPLSQKGWNSIKKTAEKYLSVETK